MVPGSRLEVVNPELLAVTQEERLAVVQKARRATDQTNERNAMLLDPRLARGFRPRTMADREPVGLQVVRATTLIDCRTPVDPGRARPRRVNAAQRL
jgi:hypothetical protein